MFKCQKEANKKSFGKILSPEALHCNLKVAISNAVKKVFPLCKIKNWYFYFYQTIYRYIRNNIGKDNLFDKKSNKVYEMCKNLCFVPPEKVIDVFKLFKKERIPNKLKQFITYFEKEFIFLLFEIKQWNYHWMENHRINNFVEGYNSKLNELFSKKPNIYKLIYELKIDEKQNNNINGNNKSIVKGKKNKRLMKSEEKILNYFIKEKKRKSKFKNSKCLYEGKGK